MIRIENVKIENLGGIQSEEFTPGEIAIRSGRNGSGKSSGLKAIRAALSGGDQKNLIRSGCDSGSVKITLSNSLEITRTFYNDKPARTEVTLHGGKITNPQTVINNLRDAFSIDILAWINLKDEEQGRLILESMPLKLSEDDVDKIIDQAIPEVADIIVKRITAQTSTHAIDLLSQLFEYVYNLRTEENREIKRIDGHLESLKQAMPEIPEGEAWNVQLKKHRHERQYLEETAKAQEQDTERKLKADLVDFTVKIQATRAAIRADYEKRDKKLLDKIHNEEKAVIQKVADVKEKVRSEFQGKLDEITKQIAQTEVKADAEKRAEGIKLQITANETSKQTAQEKSKRMTQTLSTIKAVEASLLQNTPISGLEIIEGKMFVDGVPLSELNTAKLLELSLDIAALRMGEEELRAVFVDNLECLDKQHKEQFLAKAREKTIQVFAAVVAEEDLQIKVAL